MEPKEDQNVEAHRPNTATENSDTVAVQKKRERRVSFAEITSIRFFSRDEDDNDAPSVENEKIGDGSPGEFGFGRQPGLSMEFGGEDGGNENDEDEEMDMRSSFLRPVGSPSPGGSTFGSASSNDEDNFFGPVSANFIRPGRLSDSATSDDNHDVTMDSTAFSMHYRSLARSESGADLQTPTAGKLFFEEKTPTNANIGSSMILTSDKIPIPLSSIPATEVSGSHNSNDMSLVGENPNKYDFEKLSPRLDALLAESRKDLLHVSVSDEIITSPSPKPKEAESLPSIDHDDNLTDPSDYLREDIAWIDSIDLLNEGKSAAPSEVGEANSRHGTFPSASSPKNISSSSSGGAVSNRDNDKPIKSPYQLSKDGSETSLVPTSSPVERQGIILTRASPSKQLELASELASPLPQPGSMLRNGSIERQKTETSIQKSISKLELLERSAFSSAYSAEVDNSFVKTLDFYKSPNFDHLLEKNSHMSRINFVEDSVTEEKLPSDRQSKERSYASSMDIARPEIPNHISTENHVKEHLGRIVSGKSPHELRAKDISGNQTNYGGTVSSSSKITWSGNNLMRRLFTSKHSDEDALMTETESLLAETASVGGKTIFTPEFISSPDRRLRKKLSASPGPRSTQATDSLLQRQLKQTSDIYKVRDLTPERNFDDSNLSTATANRGLEVNSLKNFIGLKSPGNEEVDTNNKKKIFATTDNFRTLAKENRSQILGSEDLDIDNLAGRSMSKFESGLPERDPRVDSDGSVSTSACGNLNESSLQKLYQNQVDLSTASPSRKERDCEQSTWIPSSRATQLSGRQENFSPNKRNLELLLRDTHHRVATTLMQRSPKLQKGGNCGPDKMLCPNKGGTTLIVHERKKWSDTYSKFSEEMKNIFSGSADKLNSKMIDALEDRLVHQQRSKVYEMLHHGNSIVLHDFQLEKIAETNSLLHQVVFEKAKLQLKCVKKERLLKRLQLLSSRIQESQKLGEIIVSQPSQICTTNVVVDAIDDRTSSFNLVKGHEVRHEKLTAMRQALDTLDRKILNLTRTFHARCNIKAEPSCADTMDLVNKHLTRRASCRLIRLEMQMWVVHSVGSENGQHNVILNYLDFIIQSINILVGPASSVSSLFKLNETNINKNFPNMDACRAFAFVFGARTVHKYIGAKTLPQETQVTSSLLGTLLDVIEEVQLAQTEFQHLTQSRFCSPSVDRLDLMLCFFNFTTGRKATLTLDMSCLKRGIYPSEFIPLQVALPDESYKCSTSEQILDEVNHAVKGVKTGYMRILRLCKCVSQVV